MTAATISDRSAELLRLLAERGNEHSRVAVERDELARILGVEPWQAELGVSIAYGTGQITDAVWLVHPAGARLVAALAPDAGRADR